MPEILGDTLLMVAADQGTFRFVEKLITVVANVLILNNDGSTPFHYAGISSNGVELANILIRSDVDVNAINMYGRLALKYALLN